MSNDSLIPAIEEDDPTEMSFAQLFKQLVHSGELILTMPDDQVEGFRKGLTQFKAKQNMKLKEAALKPDTQVLKYVMLSDDKEHAATGQARIQVRLSERAGVTVLKMELPDDKL